MARLTRRRRIITRRQRSWLDSSYFHMIRLQGLQKAHLSNFYAEKCGAKCKNSVTPCRKRAMENGRCATHGGKTPKGDQWHVPQYSKTSVRKVDKKRAELERREMMRQLCLAKMNSEQKARYDAWKKSHPAGGKTAREVHRRDRETANWLTTLRNSPRDLETVELMEIRKRIDELKAKKAQRMMAITHEDYNDKK